MTLTLDQFDFELPPDLVAQHPAPQRGASRLLRATGGTLVDGMIRDLPALLAPGDLLVFNDTRVIKARFFGEKASGGKVEVLIERIIDRRHALAQVRASKSPKPGSHLRLEDAFAVEVTGRDGEFFCLALADTPDADFWALCEAHGRLPLPPYITHGAESEDEERYQTVFARHPGAVAAPTAGLHFDDALLADLQGRGVNFAWLTLHVGAGTFQPVRVNNLAEHHMHTERYSIPPATVDALAATRRAGGRIVAVGTTALRALEAAALAAESAADAALAAGSAANAAGTPALPRPGDGVTNLFILPGYRFRVVDVLLTNFHLPKSTLLMLVSAFAGRDIIRAAYRHAIAQRYRFFSYGDAMLLERDDHAV